MEACIMEFPSYKTKHHLTLGVCMCVLNEILLGVLFQEGEGSAPCNSSIFWLIKCFYQAVCSKYRYTTINQHLYCHFIYVVPPFLVYALFHRMLHTGYVENTSVHLCEIFTKYKAHTNCGCCFLENE